MKDLLRFIIPATVLALPVGLAQVPQQLSYQGRVTVQGVNFDGTGHFKFALVQDQPASQTAMAFASIGAGGSITGITLTSGGGGYFGTPPTVTITGEGSGATATVQLHPFHFVSSITVTQPGSGYTAGTTTVTISAPPPLSQWSNNGTSVAGSEPTAAVDLPVAGGLYSVQLGDTALPNMTAPIPGTAFAISGGNPMRLRVWFSDGTHGFQQMSPDQWLTTAPYAFTAQRALTVPFESITAAEIAPGTITSSRLADGAVGASQLGAGAAAANLSASGLAGVASGGIVLSATLNPTLVTAGYNRIGSARLGDMWRTANPGAAPAARSAHTATWTGTEWIIWGGTASDSAAAGAVLGDGYRYDPGTSSWSKINSTGAPTARQDHTAVWTGTEMIVWGGIDGTGTRQASGARYNPLTDQWRPMSTIGAPAGRSSHAATWTGSELLVWGGLGNNAATLGDGARYNPATDTWTAMASTNAPSQRFAPAVSWTGTEMVVWGGKHFITVFGDGASYNPTTDQWTALPTEGAPSPRTHATATWTGSDLVVWGGDSSGTSQPGGARYHPATHAWLPVSSTGAPTPRHFHSAIWSGSEVIVWGGQQDSTPLATGAKYNPASDSWTAITPTGAPPARRQHTAVWTGERMMVFGGFAASAAVGDGWDYAPATDLWAGQPVAALPSLRMWGTMVWTGSETIIWGGTTNSDSAYAYGDGARYTPSSDSWRPVSMSGAPQARDLHCAVWTGTEMIIWGGRGRTNSAPFTVTLNTGARYNPITNTWSSMETVGAPSPRSGSNTTALWTGTEMIIWSDGGLDNARYNPATNTWASMSTAGGPPANHSLGSAVWTGQRMIVWGGGVGGSVTNNGYAYDPTNNSWSQISSVGAPAGRFWHTAVWSGAEMIVWGGTTDLFNPINTGGRYDPATNQWHSMTTVGAPSLPNLNNLSAVWTVSEMIVYGGAGETGIRYDPIADAWTAMPVEGSPPLPRYLPNLVWTGTEMLAWGGTPAINSQFPSSQGLWGFTPGRTLQLYLKP